MRRPLAALALALEIAWALHTAPAAAATLDGRVLDAQGQPVQFANVAIVALKTGAVADEQGRFTLELPAGRHDVQVSQLGYLAVTRAVEIGDRTVSLEVRLPEA